MGLPRRQRLRSSRRIRQVLRRGRRVQGTGGTLWTLPGETDSSRLCLMVPRKLGRAVRRNRLRRRLQEQFRQWTGRGEAPRDLVFRPAAVAVSASAEQLGRWLDELTARATGRE